MKLGDLLSKVQTILVPYPIHSYWKCNRWFWKKNITNCPVPTSFYKLPTKMHLFCLYGWKVLTCAGTVRASFPGIFLGSSNMDIWLRTDPESTFPKNIFHIVNQSTLSHALLSIWLLEMCPWMEDKKYMTGGTSFRNNRRMRLGRYPVITWLIIFLQEKSGDSVCLIEW